MNEHNVKLRTLKVIFARELSTPQLFFFVKFKN